MRGICFLCCLFFSLPAMAWLQIQPGDAGWHASDAYWKGSYHSVRYFDGLLKVTLPLGHEYRLSRTLSYQISLTHNSELEQSESQGSEAFPALPSGWKVSFPELWENQTQSGSKWYLRDRQGRVREFFSDLHEGVSDDRLAGQVVTYSRDGSYLRFKLLNMGRAIVERSDGEKLTFVKVQQAWRLKKVTDQTGAWYGFSYGPQQVTLTDSSGRQLYFRYQGDTLTSIDLVGVAGARVTYQLSHSNKQSVCGVALRQFIGLVNTETSAAYSFAYSDPSQPCSIRSRLARLTDPRGQRLKWSYANYAPSLLRFERANPMQVIRAEVQDRDGTTVDFANFARSHDGAVQTVQFDNAFGLAETRYFSSPNGTSPNQTEALFGFPLSTALAVQHGLPAGYLLRQSCGRSKQCIDQERVTVEFAYDPCSMQGCLFTNQRVRDHKITFLRDSLPGGAASYIQTTHADYDGLGHFRSTITASNYPGHQNSSEWINYNPDNHTFGDDGDGLSFVMPSTEAAWILNTYTQRSKKSGSDWRVTDFCYAGNGDLLRTRKRTNGTRLSTNDLITAYQYADDQQVEYYYGGEAQPVPVSPDLCGLGLPIAQYRITTDFNSGYPIQRRSEDISGTLPAVVHYNYAIDIHSGLRTQVLEAGLVIAEMEYDPVGRLLKLVDAVTQRNSTVSYETLATGSVAERAVKQDFINGTLAATTTRFIDEHGNVVREENVTADLPAREKNYRYLNARLLQAYNPAWVPLGSGMSVTNSVELSGFDLYHRPTEEWHQGALNKTHQYFGRRKVKTFSTSTDFFDPRISDYVQREQEVITETDYQGRTTRVKIRIYDDLDQASSFHYDTKDYLYGIGSKPLHVSHNNRLVYRLSYDQAGNLRSHETPTAGFAALTTRSLLRYDGLQRLLEEQLRQPASSGWLETGKAYRRDFAGRLTKVENAHTGVVYKEFVYANDNAFGLYGQGRMVKAVRHNRHLSSTRFRNGHAQSEIGYRYDLPGGKPTAQHWTLRDTRGLLVGWTQATSSTGDNRIVDIGACPQVECGLQLSAVTLPPLKLNYGYEMGELDTLGTIFNGQVQSVVASIQRDANAQVIRLDLANDVVFDVTYAPGRSGLLEQVAISGLHDSAGALIPWSSGQYVYDEHGTLLSIGSERVVPKRELSSVQSETPISLSNGVQCEPVIDIFGLVLTSQTSLNGRCVPSSDQLIYDPFDRLTFQEVNLSADAYLYDTAGQFKLNYKFDWANWLADTYAGSSIDLMGLPAVSFLRLSHTANTPLLNIDITPVSLNGSINLDAAQLNQ